MSNISVIARPTSGLVTRDQAKTYLNLEGSDEDTLLDTLILAASNYLDGPEGILHRSLRIWEYEYHLGSFPRMLEDSFIRIPLSPLQSVDSFAYTDRDEAEQSVAEEDYAICVEDGITYLAPADTWPDTHPQHSITISYTAYTGEADDLGAITLAIPKEVEVACLMLVQNLFDHRDTMIRQQFTENPAFKRLLASHRFAVA